MLRMRPYGFACKLALALGCSSHEYGMPFASRRDVDLRHRLLAIRMRAYSVEDSRKRTRLA